MKREDLSNTSWVKIIKNTTPLKLPILGGFALSGLNKERQVKYR